MYCRRRRTRCTFSAMLTIWNQAENARISSRAVSGVRPCERTTSSTAASGSPVRRPIAAWRSPSTASNSAWPHCSLMTSPTRLPSACTSSRNAASLSGKKIPLRAMGCMCVARRPRCTGLDVQVLTRAPAGMYMLAKRNRLNCRRSPCSGMFATRGRSPDNVQRPKGMAMTLRRSCLVALAAVNGATLLSVPAVLRAQAQSSGALEEIIVTARQREGRVEDVPVTITAFTQTDIRNAGIERPQDFIALTPGVSQVQTAEVGDMQVNIRGINTGRDAETNFALVVDGVLQTNPNALNQELSGVTQIEILKGPQGALYGRNAVAGALIM